MNVQQQNVSKGRGSTDVSYLGKSIDQMIWEFMEEKRIPGLTLAIVQAPYIPRVVGYGFSDVEQRRLASTRTIWPAGLISQGFAAIAAMQLHEKGKLGLTDRLSQYIGDISPSWADITVLQLMRHSTGISDYRFQNGYDATKPYTPDALLKTVRDIPLHFEPDTDVELSATNFLLLAEVIEKASGVSYHDFITEHQIRFLGLEHTCFSEDLGGLHQEDLSAPGSLHALFKEQRAFVNPTENAAGYDATGKRLPNPSSSALKGFADIWASAEDISYWDICLAGSILVEQPENHAILYGPFKLKTGMDVPAMAGWQFYRHRGLMDIKGGVPGYSAFLSRFTDPSELVCVTLLGNKEGVDFTNLARKIAGAFGDALGTGYNDTTLMLYESINDVSTTINKLKNELARLNIPVFATFDHAANAEGADLGLRPTQVLVFGAPSVGTKLMQKNQSIALELPLKIAVWEDESGSTWLAFPRMDLLANEYGMEEESVIKKMQTLLESLAVMASSVY